MTVPDEKTFEMIASHDPLLSPFSRKRAVCGKDDARKFQHANTNRRVSSYARDSQSLYFTILSESGESLRIGLQSKQFGT